jgi:hypothetical protein
MAEYQGHGQLNWGDEYQIEQPGYSLFEAYRVVAANEARAKPQRCVCGED